MLKCLVRSSLAMLGLSLVAPTGGFAQDAMPSAPAGYAAPTGLDGKPMAAAPAPTAAPHKHRGKVLCARCAAAQNPQMMPPGKIVACAHSKNGVCSACQPYLSMPGPLVVVGAPAAPDAAGRAVVSSGPTPSPSSPSMASRRAVGQPSAPYDGPNGEPTPIGVVQANFSPSAPMGSPTGSPMMMAPAASAPGHAVAEAGAGHAPYRPRTVGSSRPHIIGHLLGWSAIGGERADERALRRSEAHASISYGSEATTVNELPASAVYGKR